MQAANASVTTLFNSVSENVADATLDCLAFGDAIRQKRISKVSKVFKKFGFEGRGFHFAVGNGDPDSKIGLFFTENKLYWLLPKYPGGMAKKGSMDISEIEKIEFRKYKMPLLSTGMSDRYLKLFGNPIIVYCNDTKLGSIECLDQDDLKILRLIFNRLTSKNYLLTKEMIEEVLSQEVIVDGWMPCPRCGSSRVKESQATYMLVLLAVAYYINIQVGIEMSFGSSVILGFLFLALWYVFIGTTYKCKDCNNKWRN